MTHAAEPSAAPASGRADASTAELPRRRWPVGGLPFRSNLPPVGVVLGIDAQSGTAAFPLLVPTQSTRVGVVGDVGIARLLALRLLAQSAYLTVVTDRREGWERLAAGVPETPFTITEHLRRWPPEATAPPWALIIDMPVPPPTGFSRAPWSTVVHLVSAVPPGSGWWQSVQLVLTRRRYARSVSALRPRLDAATIERLAEEDVVAVDQSSVTAFRPAPTQREYTLLNAVDQAPHPTP